MSDSALSPPQLWELATGRLKLTLTGHISAVRALTVSPRQPYLFSAGEDKQVKCWDLEYNKVTPLSLYSLPADFYTAVIVSALLNFDNNAIVPVSTLISPFPCTAGGSTLPWSLERCVLHVSSPNH